jgi:hypothetical protein
MLKKLLLSFCLLTICHIGLTQNLQYFIELNDEWLVNQNGRYLPYIEGVNLKSKHIFINPISELPRYLIIEAENDGTSIFIDNILIKRMFLDSLLIHRIDTFSKKNILVTVFNPNGVEKVKAYVSSDPKLERNEESPKTDAKFLGIVFVKTRKSEVNVFILYFSILIVNLFVSPLSGLQKLWFYLNSLTNKPAFKNYDFLYLLFFLLVFSLNIQVINNLFYLKANAFFSFETAISLLNLTLFMSYYFLGINLVSKILKKRQISTIHTVESIKTLHIFLFADSIPIFFFTLRPEYQSFFLFYMSVFQYIVFILCKLVLLFRLNSTIDNTSSLKIIYLCITELVPSALFLSFFVKT